MKSKNFVLITSLLIIFCFTLPASISADTESSLRAIDRSIRLREYSSAVDLLQPLLKQNVAAAQFRMAELYRSGKGVKKDMLRAQMEYEKAAKNGHAKAQYSLASLLQKQGSTKQKISEIRKWFQAAANQGHRRAKIKLASLDKNINKNKSRNTSQEKIFSAIRFNDLDQIRSLLELGVNLEISDDRKRSPLMVSLIAKHQEMSKLLLKNSDHPDTPDSNNERPIHIATSNSFSDIVRGLIEKKVDINATDNFGNTAIIIATRHDDKEMLEILLDNNADYTIKNKKGQSALQIVQSLNLKKAAKVFSNYGINLPDYKNDYAKVDVESFQANIQKSSSLYKGWPLINIASLLGEEKIVAQLLKQGSDIQAKDPSGNSALHLAASKGQFKIVKLLLSNNSKVDAQNHRKETPLYAAAKSGRLKIVRYLLKEGADTSIIAKNNTSALSIAISSLHPISALSLAEGKLDNVSQHQAMLLSIKNKMEKLSIRLVKQDELIASTDTKKRTALWYSADLGLIETTKILLAEKKVDINQVDKKGYSALAQAVNNGAVKISSLLITNGASLTSLTNERNTILMLAILSQQSEVIQLVLKSKTELNMKNKAGDTALMLAASTGQNNTVKKLIELGADIQTRNQDDLNAYQIALKSGYKKTAKIIWDHSGKLFQLFNKL